MTDQRDHYRSQAAALNGGAPAWLRRVRERGLARFLDLGFPTPRLEEWKYTNVGPIAEVPFRRAEAPAVTPALAKVVAAARLGAGRELVFANGRFVPELSSPVALTGELIVTSLAAAAHEHTDLVAKYLGACAGEQGHAFAALNEAFIHDGAFVWLERGAQVADPIHLLFVSAERGETFGCPRSLVVAGESGSVTIVETYLGLDAGRSFTNAVTEVFAAANAAVRHIRIQEESETAFHVGSVVARQEASSRFTSLSIALGGALSRTDVESCMTAPGAECRLDGLYMTRGRQHVDHHTTIDHRQPHCSSRELYKGVLDGRSTAVFNGKVFVRPGAQKSDAQQVNKNLLLSEAAEVNTKPQLEIFADDVKCSHGATIGRLDDDALFYLRARGIDRDEARNLLVYGFANELITHVPVAAVRERLDRTLRGRLRREAAAEAIS
jgi:Fe-S cluster assembly protein SufD